jgi:predicted TIM-barrel fold metal-dependent hydrolase
MTSDDAPMPVWISTMACNSMMTLADLAFSDVFHRFPRLRVSLAEGGIGWIPYLLERMDYVWERHRYYTGIDFDTRPSDLYRRHVWGCFIDDVAGIAMRETIGIDRIMWESDYPHSDGTWPDSRKRLDEVLTDVPEDDCRRIAETNAREFFRFEG